MENNKTKLNILLLLGLSLTMIQAQTVKDIDGNTYKTVTIGTQTWMAENLKTTAYNDGTTIPLVTDETVWTSLSSPGYCWYNNDETAFKGTYGAIYNWYAVDAAGNNSKNVCPTGWHVPTKLQWTILTDYLTNNGYGYAGSGKDIAKSMASASGWSISLTAGNAGNDQASNNSSGLTALPGGYRDFDGEYDTFGGYAAWWSSSGNDMGNVWALVMVYTSSEVGLFDYAKQVGFSIRCLKDY